jgi:hypothetical protein
MESLIGIKRTRIATNVILQIALWGLIILFINFLGFVRYARWDLSRTGKLALSGQTRKVISSIKREATIYVYLSPASVGSPGAELYDNILGLLKEYEAAAHRKLRVVVIDPYRDIGQARQLQGRFKLGSNDSVLVFEYDGRSKLVRVTDLAEYDPAESLDHDPGVRAFKGEQVFTSALLELMEPKQMKVGFLIGHGEPAVGPGSPLSRFIAGLKTQNIAFEEINLIQAGQIPPEFSALILLGLSNDLSDGESIVLRKYWMNQGRLLIGLSPRSTSLPRLHNLLTSVGLNPDEDILVTKMRSGFAQQSLSVDVYARFSAETSFLKSMSQTIGFFPGGTASLSVDRSKLSQLGITATRALTPLLDSYWGEKDDFLTRNTAPAYHPKADLDPPLVFGWALEKGSIQDERVRVRSLSRMVMVGNSDFLRDETLVQASANLDFALLALNWLTDREQLLAIAPKEAQTYVLRLRPGQMTWIVLLVVGGIPLLVATFGMAVWATRRR